MPRKQRFKPSRKPKPTPQSEDAVIGRQVQSVPAFRDDAWPGHASQPRDDDSPTEAETDQRSR